MSNKKEVVLLDINTREQTTYESMTSLAKELRVSVKHISSYIKMKSVFRKKYYIFLKEDVPNDKDIIPYYYENVKINMYTTSGKYVKTFDNLKDIRKYLADKYCKNLHNFYCDYSNIIEIINKKNRRIYDYMFRSFKNNESCEDIDPYIPNISNSTGESKPVILMDIYTKDKRSYESMSSLQREFGLSCGYIKDYIKKNYIFRKRYYIFLEDHPAPNAEEIISNYLKKHPVPPNTEEVPYYLKNEKINMYTKDGKYVKTFDTLKDINDYLLDICNRRYSYKHIIKNIDKNDGSICGYMFKSFKNNDDCKDIEPYKIRKTKKEVILMDINTNEQKTYDSLRSLGEEFGISSGDISVYIKNKIIFRKKYYIFLKGDPVPNIKPKRRKEVVLIDINTKNQTIYRSLRSLAREFGVGHNCISNHIKRKTLFRKKYYIFLKEDVPNDNA